METRGGAMHPIIEAATDVGMTREHNEDSFLAIDDQKEIPGLDALLVVADGMGGHAAGEVASSTAVRHIQDRLASGDFLGLSPEALLADLQTLVEDANKVVYTAGQDPDKYGMGATCTLVGVKDGVVYYCHVGDSRLYILREGHLKQVTKDHSWVEEAVDMGLLTRDEAHSHPRRNIIPRDIGLTPEVEVDSGRVRLSVNDLVLVCSDGLNSMLSDDEIRQILDRGSPGSVCNDLVLEANRQGGDDNTTVVIAHF